MKNKEKKPKSKARNIIEWVLTCVIGAVFLFVAAANISKLLTRNAYGEGTSFGYGVFYVQTNSMEPSYKTGSAIITYKYKPQEIIEHFDKIKDLDLKKTDERCINLTFNDEYSVKHPTGIPGISEQTPITKAIMTHQMFKYEINTSKQEGNGRYIFYVHGINEDSDNYRPYQYQVFTEKELIGEVKVSSGFLGTLTKMLTSVWGLLICLLIPGLYLIIVSVLDMFKAYNNDEEFDSSGTNTGSSAIEGMSQSDYERLKQEMIDEMLNGKGKK